MTTPTSTRTGPLGLPIAFWVLWSAVLVLAIGRFVSPLLASFLANDRDLDAATIGLVVAAFGAGGTLAALLGGYFADRFSRLGVIVVGELSSAVLLVVLAQPGESVAVTTGLLFAYGFTAHLANPALASLVSERVAPHQRERAYSLYTWAMNCGFAIGPLCAAWLSTYSFALVFYLEAMMLVAVAGLLALTLRRSGGAAAPRGQHITLITSFGVLARDRVFLLFVLAMMMFMAVYFQCITTLPIVMGEAGFSVPSYGLLLTINGVLLCLFQIPFIRVLERIRTTTILAWAMGLSIAGYLVQAFATAWWHYAVAVVLWTLGELGVYPVASTITADLAPPHLLATYQGINGLNNTAGLMLASLAGGVLLTAVGAQGLWLCCIAALVVVLALFLGTGRSREQRQRDGRAAAQSAVSGVR